MCPTNVVFADLNLRLFIIRCSNNDNNEASLILTLSDILKSRSIWDIHCKNISIIVYVKSLQTIFLVGVNNMRQIRVAFFQDEPKFTTNNCFVNRVNSQTVNKRYF